MIFFSAGVSFLVRLIKGSGAAWHAGRERDMERQFCCVRFITYVYRVPHVAFWENRQI